jgi:hypothetical protein
MIALSASKSDGFRVYGGRLLAAAVEAMSKSASRQRFDCPARNAGTRRHEPCVICSWRLCFSAVAQPSPLGRVVLDASLI